MPRRPVHPSSRRKLLPEGGIYHQHPFVCSRVRRFTSLFCLTPDSQGTARTKVVLRMGPKFTVIAVSSQCRTEENKKTYRTGHTAACKEIQSQALTLSSFPVRPEQTVSRDKSKWFCHWGLACGPESRRSWWGTSRWREALFLGAGKAAWTRPPEEPACERAFPVVMIGLSLTPKLSHLVSFVTKIR